MITAFRVQNLRSIVDSGRIRLAKINVLVGRNSAGKSTLLRVLPLLRQSVERPTKGPILWYGRLVDFGTFQNAVNAIDKSRGVVLDFSMNLPGTSRASQYGESDESFLGGTEAAHFYKALPKVNASLTLGVGSNDEVGRARSFSVDLGADTVEVSLGHSSSVPSVKVNGQYVELASKRMWHTQPGKILPIPMVLKEESFDEAGTTRKYVTHEIRPFSELLIDVLAPLFHGNTSREKIAEFSSTLLYAGEVQFYEQLQNQASFSSSFTTSLAQFTAQSPWIAEIRKAVLLTSLSGVIRRVDRELFDFATGVRYVEPIRATAERYYRHQDLAVDEIDSRGENAAMFLSSLNYWEKSSLREWMLKHLGFFADVEQGSGHVQVKICSEEGVGKNIADLGFGYSQLLPIILQMWRSLVEPQYSRFRSESRAVLAIEQPELHLHPQFQAQIADVLAAVLAEGRKGHQSPAVFIETHSEHIINRLGQLIARGRIGRGDVQVLVVEGGEGGASSVRSVSFDGRGFLDEGWPAGFFVPEMA